ncbi:type II secretion system protein GspN [bacterium]|nr:type II secretion system protein GspN [candidate division CSSED10-310 bacterium]
MSDQIRPSWLFRLIRWIVVWCLLPVAVLYAAVAIWHPEETMIRRLLSRIRTETGARIGYSNLAISLRGGLIFKNMTVDMAQVALLADAEQSAQIIRRVLTANRVAVTMAWAPLLAGKAGLNLDMMMYSGRLRGTAQSPLINQSGIVHLDLQWQDLDLAELSGDYPELILKQGRISGCGDLVLDPDRTGGPVGWMTLDMRSLDYFLTEQVSGTLGFQSIRHADGKIFLEMDRYRFEEFWLRGDTGSIRISGSMKRSESIDRTDLNLELRIHNHGVGESPDPKQYLPVKIRGTARKPVLEFLGMVLESDFDQTWF